MHFKEYTRFGTERSKSTALFFTALHLEFKAIVPWLREKYLHDSVFWIKVFKSSVVVEDQLTSIVE